jgi:CubicO group peptidase (beta-lactamase class C family)
MNKKIFALVIIAILVVAIAAGIIFFLSQVETVDSRIQYLMEQGDIPSLAAGIVVNDNMVWSSGFGEQSDLDTVYMIGSVTKMFTATAIMQLYDNGVIDLDADVNDYLPFSVRHPEFPNTPITIRMLLSHRSRLADSVSNKPLWDYSADMINWANDNLEANIALWDSRPTLEEFLEGSITPSGKYYSPDNWGSQPETDWEYSSTGYLLLAYVVEQLTGQSFSEYLQQNVLTPLDMQSTGYDYVDFTGRNAIPYEWRDNANFEYPIYNQYDLGGGGLRSTVPDLGNFLIAHMNRGQYYDTLILQPDTVDLMQTSQFSMFGHGFGGFSFAGYGLGWPLYQDQIIGHGGAVPGYLAEIAFKTEGNSKFGIVLLLNRGDSLVEDDYLINLFLPKVINLLFDEATQLSST